MSTSFSVRYQLAQMAAIVAKTDDRDDPMSWLTYTALQYPHQYEQSVEDIASGKQVGYRLNGAGLKLYARRGKMRVGGDQAHLHATFVEAANILLKG